MGQRSVKVKGTRVWCSLPEQLRLISSTRSFKRKLKEFLQHVGMFVMCRSDVGVSDLLNSRIPVVVVVVGKID